MMKRKPRVGYKDMETAKDSEAHLKEREAFSAVEAQAASEVDL